LDFDQALEDVVPEDMLSEPIADDVMAACSKVPDDGLRVSQVVSRASSTMEGSLRCRDAGPSHLTPMEVIEELSALEVATAEDPTPKGGAGSYLAPEGVAGSDPALVGSTSCNPAPEGVQVGSPAHTSMDVHVGSSPPRSDRATTVHVSPILNEQVALEVGDPDARNLISAGGAKITPNNALQIIPANLPPSSHGVASPALGLPSFLSNLQVSHPLGLYCPY
jgi:hypothetical protein